MSSDRTQATPKIAKKTHKRRFMVRRPPKTERLKVDLNHMVDRRPVRAFPDVRVPPHHTPSRDAHTTTA
jgi:hypothetical protein